MQLKRKRRELSGLLCFRASLLLVSVTLATTLIQGCSVKYVGPEIVKGGVKFSFKAVDARKVVVAGSFNQWDTERDVLSGPNSDGVWQITIPIPEGRYEYLFLVDGERWEPDPGVPFVDDGVGGRNSVVYVKRQ